MSVVFQRCALLAIALFSAGASAAPGAIEPLLERSPNVTFTQGGSDGKPVFRGQLQQFANGDTLLRVGEGEGQPVLLILCSQQGWINPVGETGSGKRLAGKDLQALRMMQYMGTLTGVAMVQGIGGETLQVPSSDAAVASTGSNAWAYGREQFTVSTRHVAGQGLQVRAVKTSHGATEVADDPDATFSTADDRQARLAELEPVGTWRELVIADGERPASVPAAMSLRGWLPSAPGGKAVATVGEGRSACNAE
ncbi:hypothetical protein ACTUVK_003294 [Stenotrophomonas rhizophila]